MQNKFLNIEKSLNSFFFDRENEIHGLILSVLTGSNLVQISPPGTGKSLMFSEFSRFIVPDEKHQTFFRVLYHPTLKISEVFGPEDIREFIENKKLVRNGTNFIQNSYFVFADEVFKANDVQLNPLLTIMNEHIFQIDGLWKKVPLISMFCASNEIPSGNLSAFRDRILFWYKINYLSDEKMRLQYLKKSQNKIEISSEEMISISEIYEAQKQVSSVSITDDTYEMLLNIFIKLEEKGIINSDRRQRQVLPILQATAWLAGKTETCIEDCTELIPCLWNDEKDIIQVTQIVIKECNSNLQKILDLQDVCVNTYKMKQELTSEQLRYKFEDIKRDIDILKPSERNKKAYEKMNFIWNLYMTAICKVIIAEKEMKGK